jgi:hypothetical protein
MTLVSSTTKLACLVTVIIAAGFAALNAIPAFAAPALYLAGQTCEDGAWTVSFRWESPSPVLQRWLDLTTEPGWPGSVMSIDVTTNTNGRVDWSGLDSRTYYYARLNQQLEDGSWESSSPVGFQTRVCGAGPVLGAAPTILGFAVDSRPTTTTVSPPGSTLNRSCEETTVHALVSFPNFLAVLGNATVPEWRIDGVLQPTSAMEVLVVRGPGEEASVNIELRLGAAPTRPYDVESTLRFPRTQPPVEASFRMTCM